MMREEHTVSKKALDKAMADRPLLMGASLGDWQGEIALSNAEARKILQANKGRVHIWLHDNPGNRARAKLAFIETVDRDRPSGVWTHKEKSLLRECALGELRLIAA